MAKTALIRQCLDPTRPLKVRCGTWHQNVSKQHQRGPKFSQQNISQSLTLPLPASFFFPRSAPQVSVADGHVSIVSAFDSATGVTSPHAITQQTAMHGLFQHFSRPMYSCSSVGLDHTACAPHMHHWSFLGPFLTKIKELGRCVYCF